VDEKFSITPRPGNYFWSDGYSWGNVQVNGKKLSISVHYGSLKLKKVEIKGAPVLVLKQPVTLKEGNTGEFVIAGN
jgi:hypothetical protein